MMSPDVSQIEIPDGMLCKDKHGNEIHIGDTVMVAATSRFVKVNDIVYLGFEDRSLCDIYQEPGFMIAGGDGLINAADTVGGVVDQVTTLDPRFSDGSSIKEWIIAQFEAVEARLLSIEQFEAFVSMIGENLYHPSNFFNECFKEFLTRKAANSNPL